MQHAIFYAKPVQDNLPAHFLGWLSRQELTPKQLVQLMYRCLEEGCDAVMNGIGNAPKDAIPTDSVTVQTVDLRLYDALCCRQAGVSS